MKKRLLTTVLAACMLLAGCSAPVDQTSITSVANQTEDSSSADVVTAGFKELDFKNIDSKSYDEESMRKYFMRFVFDFYSKTAEGSDENIMVSPYSLMTALELAAAGADGDTLKQMISLYGDPEDPEATMKYISDLMKKLNSSEGVKLKVANSAWLRDKVKDSPARNEYIKTIADYLESEIKLKDFGDPDGLIKEINDWVDGKTDGMIPQLLDELPDDCVAVLVNTIVFDGKWGEAFSGTSQKEFHGKSGDKETEFMNGKAETYLETDKATGFIKVYEGGEFAFVAMLPADENVSMADFVKDLKPEEFEEFYKSGEGKATVSMPSFTSRYKMKAPGILKELGMTDAFDPGKADFSGIEDGIYISDVIHETYIEVTKKGTRAAAASAVTMRKSASFAMDVKHVELDRPFMYAIVDTATGTPVFIGHLQDI